MPCNEQFSLIQIRKNDLLGVKYNYLIKRVIRQYYCGMVNLDGIVIIIIQMLFPDSFSAIVFVAII